MLHWAAALLSAEPEEDEGKVGSKTEEGRSGGEEERKKEELGSGDGREKTYRSRL
jgi:hypothetical protein